MTLLPGRLWPGVAPPPSSGALLGDAGPPSDGLAAFVTAGVGVAAFRRETAPG